MGVGAISAREQMVDARSFDFSTCAHSGHFDRVDSQRHLQAFNVLLTLVVIDLRLYDQGRHSLTLLWRRRHAQIAEPRTNGGWLLIS